jgi:hypothetical protein
MDKHIENDKELAKKAIKVYLEHFLIPERDEILEDLICELDDEGFIDIKYIEIY